MRKRSATGEVAVEEEVETPGVELKEELEKNEPKTRERVEFECVNRKKDGSPLASWGEKIIETILLDDPHETYKTLEAELRIGSTRNEHGSLMKALDNAETNARDAHRLWMTAKVERERWENANAVVHAAMRYEATRTLEREKEQKLRTKQITDGDVDSYCASLFGDEYVAQENKRRKVKAMESDLEHLSEMWNSRCRSLQAMLGKSR